MESNLELACIKNLENLNTEEDFLMISSKDLAVSQTLMAKYMKENGKMANMMGLANILGQITHNIPENFQKERNMGKACINLVMDEVSKEYGSMEKEMVWENYGKGQIAFKENGLMTNMCLISDFILNCHILNSQAL